MNVSNHSIDERWHMPWGTDDYPYGWADKTHFAAERLGHYEKRVYALVRRSMEKHLRRELRRRLRRAMPLVIGSVSTLSKCLPELGRFDGVDRPLESDLLATALAKLISDSVRQSIVNQLNAPFPVQRRVAVSVVSELAAGVSLLDMQLRMPPIRKERGPVEGKPVLTGPQRRARDAARKFKQWQRKAALAKTKLAAYRKKLNHYKKKGVV